MKSMFTSSSSTFVKITAFSLLSFSLFFLFKHFSLSSTTTTAQSHHLSFFNSTPTTNPSTPPPPPPPPPPPAAAVLERTGIVNEMGVMTDEFTVGEFDEELIKSVVVANVNASSNNEDKGESDVRKVVKFGKFRFCDESMGNYIPCLDNVDDVSRFNSSEKGGNYERRCPANGKKLDCLVPRPKGYKIHIPWPKSRDEVWFDNVPRLVEEKGDRDWISRKDDKFIFRGNGPQFIPSTDWYLDQISKMVPEIAFGQHTRVVLDIDSGVANFGAYLIDRNVTTLSISPKYVGENQIQFALERGVPAMLASFGGTHRLPFSSQAFDLIHCSRCRINWTNHDGILLLEANRILRGGGYFVWESKAVNEGELIEHWREMEDLTSKICWDLVNKEGYLAIWQKPLNNSCYLNRDRDVIKPSLCDTTDNPDEIWYVNAKACITRLPENGYGANITNWPARLHSPPERLFTIKMDAFNSRRELYKADSKYWNDIVSGYIGAFHMNELNLRNIMDMKAGYGGFAAALIDFEVNSWVMNVVPVSGSNTLPVIFDRGLIGVIHDWCEPFDTYPRTYDMLNAAGLFSVEQKRCNISSIVVEMDRILRPGGRVYVRDITSVINELEEIAKAVGWVTFVFDSGEGPHSNWKLLTCEKRL
ncbi:hypothetical protein ABFS83_03G100900 [Erythranthe nasuta]